MNSTMALRIVSVLALLLTVSCAGKDDTRSIGTLDAKATYEKGMSLLKSGLCSSDKYMIGIREPCARSPDEEPEFKPKPGAQEGLKLIAEAHKMGHQDASFIFAKAMEVGILTEEDYPASIELYRKLAEAGHVLSQYELGQELMYGRLTKDPFLFKKTGTTIRTDVEAFSWYLKAAKNGYPVAQNSVAVCYQRGSGTERDPSASFKWAKLSAYAGYAGGQMTLGIHYINAEAVDQDLDVANAWFKIASDSPDVSIVRMYMQKIASHVDPQRSSAIEAQLRKELQK
jgi:TPR repeat protein